VVGDVAGDCGGWRAAGNQKRQWIRAFLMDTGVNRFVSHTRGLSEKSQK
jgi:hypothetical protein